VTSPVTIAGAGPAGLAAALAVVGDGGRARVVERRHDAGARFHGDFQGLENWSTKGDVLEELETRGIRTAFEHTPFRECLFFDPDGRERLCRSSKPLWYLVRRGTERGTLDQALKAQALAEGVEITWGRSVDDMPDGGIVAHGPRRADAIAVGYVFETDRADGAYAAVSDDLAPSGYAYALVCRGRATLATCLFSDFRNHRLYLERTAEFFERRVGIRPMSARRFGGIGTMAPEPRVREGRRLFVGEAAGLQDALFGFGIRYALASGYFAGRAWAAGNLDEYVEAYRRYLRPRVRASAVNRYAYRLAGARGYRVLVDRVCGARDPRRWLRDYYAHHWWTSLVYPMARMQAVRRERPDVTGTIPAIR